MFPQEITVDTQNAVLKQCWIFIPNCPENFSMKFLEDNTKKPKVSLTNFYLKKFSGREECSIDNLALNFSPEVGKLFVKVK